MLGVQRWGSLPPPGFILKTQGYPGSWEAALPARGSRVYCWVQASCSLLMLSPGSWVCSSRLAFTQALACSLSAHPCFHLSFPQVLVYITSLSPAGSPTQPLFPSPAYLFAHQPSSFSLKGPHDCPHPSAISFFKIVCMCSVCVHLFVHNACAGVQGGQKKALDTLELSLQVGCEPPSVDAGN